MLTSSLLTAAAALVAGVNAQSTTTSGSSSATSSGSSSTSTPSGKIVEINVGAEVHKFTPDSVTANVGDIILVELGFNFYPGGHRVARAEFKQPCIPYEYTGAGKRGFWTGIFSPQVISVPPPNYDVPVNDTDPIFFYCGAPGSCNQYSMVGVVNPTKEMTLDIQKAYAANSSHQLVPGEPFPSETLKPTNTPTSTPPTGGNGETGGSSQDASKGSGNSSLGAGAIAGIAIGAAAVLVMGAGIIYLCGRRGGFERAHRKGIQPIGPHGSMAPGAINGGMVENRYMGPTSPGQHTVASFPGAERDPYRFSGQTTTPLAGHFTGTPPPPNSPGLNGFYQSSVAPSQHFDNASQHAYYAGVTSPQPIPSPQFQSTPSAPPSELPAADHPSHGHSPPPQYPVERRDSYTTGGAASPSKFK
ncbi:hypothetical protein B0T14DRAFT_573791 [Immersiella caudata]|uniref:GPI-anchored cupredoxin n=1 Tax=Immersiella caudata TaxID=314043 RepID=A0AA39XF93_9PEZI|nr:hypothetical protein B0T14DRAFT_573791 [Immersiella caudata]